MNEVLTRICTARFSEAERETLQALAVSRDMSTSAMIRRFVLAGLVAEARMEALAASNAERVEALTR